MKNVIKFLLILGLYGCTLVVGDDCDPDKGMPNQDPRSCRNNCCEFVVYNDAAQCYETWCFTSATCTWKLKKAPICN